MIYFKFTEKGGVPMSASVKVNKIGNLTPEQKADFFERVRRLLNVENIEEISKEEFEH